LKVGQMVISLGSVLVMFAIR